MFCATEIGSFCFAPTHITLKKQTASFKTSWSPAGRAGRIFRDVMCARRGSVRAGAQLRAGEHKQNRPAAVSGLFYVVVIIS